MFAFAILPSACDAQRDLTAKDTERRPFTVSCPPDRECQVVAKKGNADAEAQPTLHRQGKLIAVCDSADSAAYDCRPLRCDSPDDCPHERGRVVDCSRGFCVDPDRALTREDVVMLCLSGTGPGHDLPVQRERYARALEAGERPRVPAGCASP